MVYDSRFVDAVARVDVEAKVDVPNVSEPMVDTQSPELEVWFQLWVVEEALLPRKS